MGGQHTHPHETNGDHAARVAAEGIVRDPVCAMTVDPAAGKPQAEYAGRIFHFCSTSCQGKFTASPERYLKATDPVCGMQVDRAAARHFLRHEGQGFYFCSARCAERFAAAPHVFLGDRPAAAPARAGTKYTCPMHPEIVRDGPGSCPICGMALEPMGVPTGEEGPNPELVDFTRRLWVSAALSLPLLLIAMGPMVGLPVRDWLGERLASWLELALASPVVLWAALPFFRRGYEFVVNRSPNMWTLISVGVGAAYVYSVAATLLPGLFPHGSGRPWRRRPGLFRGGGGHRGAGVRRTGAGAQGARAHRFGHPGLARPVAEDGAKNRRGRRRGRCPAGRGEGGRQAQGAARRVGSCRRRGPGRAFFGGRIDAYRGAVAGGKRPGRPPDRRHAEPQWQPDHEGGKGGHRYHAGPDRRHGRQGAAQPGADSGAGRPSGRLFRARGGVRRRARLRRLAASRPGAGASLCAGGGGLGADHRLPLRARAGDADVDHDRHRPRREGRRARLAMPRRWSASLGSTRWSSTRRGR